MSDDPNVVVWAALDACPDPVMLSLLEPPFILDERPDGQGPIIQGQMEFFETPKSVRFGMTTDAALQLLAVLDAYRQRHGLEVPPMAQLRQQ